MKAKLETALTALCADAVIAIDTRTALLAADNKATTAIEARGAAMQTERERRDRAGVRVSVADGGIDSRRLQLAIDSGVLAARSSGEHSRSAGTFQALLFRATSLLLKMRDELDAPEHAAAVRAEAEAAAFLADRAEREMP